MDIIMNLKEQVISDALNDIDWDRFFAFARAVDNDTGLNRADLRFAKGKLLQYAFDNVSNFNVDLSGSCHNLTIPTAEGNARVLMRFDHTLQSYTPKSNQLCSKKITVILKNPLTEDRSPTLDDFDAVLLIGVDIAVCINSTAIKCGSGKIAKKKHQYVLNEINRFDIGVLTFTDNNNYETLFSSQLSQQLDQVLYSFSQKV